MQRTGAGAHPYIENARTYVVNFHTAVCSSTMNFTPPILPQAGTIIEMYNYLNELYKLYHCTEYHTIGTIYCLYLSTEPVEIP